MSGYHLAQFNIAAVHEPLESPSMADFVANLERINALAEQSPGFVWHLEYLRANGATAQAFTFRNAFPAPRPDGT